MCHLRTWTVAGGLKGWRNAVAADGTCAECAYIGPRAILECLLLGVCVCQRCSQLERGVSALAAEDERGHFPFGASLDGVLACVRREYLAKDTALALHELLEKVYKPHIVNILSDPVRF